MQNIQTLTPVIHYDTVLQEGVRVYLMPNREIAWQSKIQVGTTYHQSPVFLDEMKYVDFNPTWTAIVREDGVVFFYNDVYERDQKVAGGLDEPFTIELPDS